MPLGFERLNERVKRPNPLINFIKPLSGSTSTYAQDFLERIAAICYPIMKANYIAVMALEEYEWNPEFIGRNFNAGEVIQLVLRSRSGSWLPFRHVQMVMMHELAHCKEMNHSRAFWKVRDAYAGELRGLWGKNYTGEGLWGRGQTLLSAEYVTSEMPDTAELPEHMCGGTFRSRGRKRKRKTKEKPKISYAERQQKRILKKFGAGGVALGDDESTRVKLEEGKKLKGKPRVAGSARGRELRAAAALARFDKAKDEEVKREEDDTDSDSDSEYDWPPTEDGSAPVGQDGKEILDSKGHGMVKVCDVEDSGDDNFKREMQELSLLDIPEVTGVTTLDSADNKHDEGDNSMKPSQRTAHKKTDAKQVSSSAPSSAPPMRPKPLGTKAKSKQKPTAPPKPTKSKTQTQTQIPQIPSAASASNSKQHVCTACSLVNEPSATICIACSNVLDPAKMPNHWRCMSLACRGGVYVNSGDYGRCAICGAAKVV